MNELLTPEETAQEIKRLIGLLQAKWRTVNGREPRAAWAAMMRFAASRGFEPAIIYKAVDKVLNTCGNED